MLGSPATPLLFPKLTSECSVCNRLCVSDYTARGVPKVTLKSYFSGHFNCELQSYERTTSMTLKSKNKRLDEILVERGLVETRNKAKALILAGEVLVNETPVSKAGTMIAADALIRIRQAQKFVSRGGLKLEGALSQFGIDVSDRVCLDVGASTGGFTDCLLQHGAKKVYAVDVGYGQMHWKLQTDARVVRHDRVNFRNLDIGIFLEPVEVIVVDASFISLRLLLDKIAEIFRSQFASSGDQLVVALFKPQFEVGPDHVGKGGIVKDEAVREQILLQRMSDFESVGFLEVKSCQSSIKGTDGNVEYFIFATWPQRK